MVSVTRIFEFEAAHFLKDHPGKCVNLHGHSYKLEVSVTGPILPDGMIIDFSQLKDIVETTILYQVDHKCLNDEFPMFGDKPTAERLVEWMVKDLRNALNKIGITLIKIKLYETRNSFVEWINENPIWG